MMLQVVKHAERKHILPTRTLRAGKIGVVVRIMMHRPDGEKGHQELADDHNDDVVNEKGDIEIKHQGSKDGNGSVFQQFVAAVFRID